MRALRDGDRFWYENAGVFTGSQLAELRRHTTLAKIVCENGDDIRMVQRDLFVNAKYPNEMLACDRIVDMSLEPWRHDADDDAAAAAAAAACNI